MSGGLEEKASVTSAAVTIGEERIEYEAVAESTILRDDDGRDACSIFSVSYRRTGGDNSPRPVIYAFDGGPGTASVTLHLGLLGPRRGDFSAHDLQSRVPLGLIDNQRSLLDVADLVIVDPVATGFSRPSPREPRRFFGYVEDVRCMARFIAAHYHRSGRSDAPLVILGESYGGARAAGVLFELQDHWSLYPCAAILLVPVLSHQALSFTPGNDLPYVLYLPMMAAAARYHGRAGQSTELWEWVAEAERFAVEDYAPALLRGRRLEASERTSISKRIADYTGLTAEYVERNNLRVTDLRFFKELLRESHHVLSRADCRVQDVDGDAAGDVPEHDPYTDYIRRAFDPAVNSYVRGELGYETSLEYLLYNRDVLPWSYAGVAENSFHFAAESLRLAMTKHASMKVFVGSGLYDGAVPHLAVENALDVVAQEAELAANLTAKRYETGHILYFEEPAGTQVRDDLADFIGGACRE